MGGDGLGLRVATAAACLQAFSPASQKFGHHKPMTLGPPKRQAEVGIRL